MSIFGRDNNRSFIIAEIAQAHDGSLGMAHAYIDAAANARVDAVKFQTHIAAAESTFDEPFRTKFSVEDKTRYGYWRRMEFSREQWQGLKEHALSRDILFLSSPFSLEAVELLERIEVPAWKIGSGETISGDLMDAIIETGKPILLSTGMSTYGELDELVKRFRSNHIPFALLQCTSKYPVDFAEVGLNVIQEMRQRYDCPVGLSDHSGNVYPALAAMAQGANIIEAHIAFHKGMFGPDTSASLTVRDFCHLTDARDAFQQIRANPVDKDTMAQAMAPMREMFSKSLAPVRDLKAGEVLTDALLVAKKPGGGVSLNKKKDFIGKKLINDVSQGRLLRWADIDF